MPTAPLSVTDILHEHSGQVSDAASASVSLSGALDGFGNPGLGVTTAGTKIILVVHHSKAINTPSGFTNSVGQPITDDVFDAGSPDNNVTLFHKDNGPGGETGWTINVTSGTAAIQWYVLEVARMGTGGAVGYNNMNVSATDTSAPYLVTTNGITIGNPNYNDMLIVGGFMLQTTKSPASIPSLSVTERPSALDTPWRGRRDQSFAADGSLNHLMVGVRGWSFPRAKAQFTATMSGYGTATSAVDENWVSFAVGFRSAASGIADPLVFADGFEYGITPNTSAPATTNRMMDLLVGWGTQVAVISTAPRSGTYHLDINQTGQAGQAGWDTNTLGTSKDDAVWGFGFRPVSSTGTVVVAEIAPAAGTILQLVYDTSTSKLGLRWGSGGTVAWQQYTTPTGAYVWVDLAVDGFTGTTRSASWSINGIEEDGPTDLTGQTASSLLSKTFGLNAAQTCRFYIDDVCLATTFGNYPLGPHNVRLLTVDPAGTPVGVGSSATLSFNTFSANGTLAAFVAVAARDALDEVPANISATSDGLVQITAGAVYIRLPMATYTLLSGEWIDYVGLVAPLWANSAQTANIQFRGVRDNGAGTAVTLWSNATLFNPGNAAQPPSATVPMWLRAKWGISGNWIQTDLDGAVIEMGNSTDATPDIGAAAVYLIVAVAERVTSRVYGPDEDGLTVDVTRGALNNAHETYDITAAASRAATFYYTKDDVQQDPVTIAAGSGVTSVTVDASVFDQVSRFSVVPDPVA